jgi:hypothetical protein
MARKKAAMHFKTMIQAEVPQGRNGKHKSIVTTIINDLDQLKDGSALKIPLLELAESKEKVRSALKPSHTKGPAQGGYGQRRNLFVYLEPGRLTRVPAHHLVSIKTAVVFRALMA